MLLFSSVLMKADFPVDTDKEIRKISVRFSWYFVITPYFLILMQLNFEIILGISQESLEAASPCFPKNHEAQTKFDDFSKKNSVAWMVSNHHVLLL